jgi:membrane fusion protein (multidrug efflux system)
LRTLRAVEADGTTRRLIPLAVIGLLLTGWSLWFCVVPVAVYETSHAARLEVDRAVHPVESALAGKILSTRLTLGALVHAGDPLVLLDDERERRRLLEEERRLAGVRPQREALLRAIAAEEAAQRLARQTSRSTVDEADARRREGEAVARFADDEADRLAKLRGKLSDLELLRARAEAEKERAAARALGLDLERVQGDERTRERLTEAHLEQLHRDLAAVASEIDTTAAAADVLAQDIERHVLRAPVDGRVGSIAPGLQPGAVLREGGRVATIVPAGELRVTADFVAQAALGRILPGQRARLRLYGFPWTQFGSVQARVTSVEAEPRDGRVRVELAVVTAPPAIPMQHGLPGMIEVEVERVTPATLLLRAVGRVVTRR